MYDDQDLMGDEFGASERRIARLLRRKAKLEALLPAVRSPIRQKAIAARLRHIDKVLARSGYSAGQGAAVDMAAYYGVEGVGGLGFQVNSPPGLGRLVRLPFYPDVANARTNTSAGMGILSAVNPVFIEIPAAGGITAGLHVIQTPQVSWATLRIVGFECNQRAFRGIAAHGPAMLVSDLMIGGGANLFTHEDFADATIYDADQPEFCGLRDYPVLKSPNTATVSCWQVDNVAGEALTFSAAILCEVLVDDNYGAHVPGPYARQGAMVREGGSFI